MSKAVMQQALEALENAYMVNSWAWVDQKKQVITALRAALAEPEQEPISLNDGRLTQYPDGRIGFGTLESVGAIVHAPAPRKPQTTHWEGCEAVHPECSKPEQPVAWQSQEHGDTEWVDCGKDAYGINPRRYAYRALYTAPAPRKPLTDEEMRECAQEINAEPLAEGWPELIKFARAIERAHGIGEQHE